MDYKTRMKRNGWISLVCGCISLTLSFSTFGFLAIVIGGIGLAIGKEAASYDGNNMVAKAGVIVSLIGAVIGVIHLVTCLACISCLSCQPRHW
ncbi:MAG: hypothetical protein Q4Q17_00215 [Tissierellia bacterium]|nr:hypothetical protein [Tissierellia bacterium]